MIDQNDRAVIGGNSPPAYDPEILAALRDEANRQADAAGQWMSKGMIATEADAALANDHVSGLRRLKKRIDDARAEAKRPHDERAREVQGAFTPLLDGLDRAIKAVLAMQTDYMRRKQEEIDRQKREDAERARAAREEAERMARAAEARNDVMGAAAAETAMKEAEKAEKAAARAETAKIASATGGGRTMGLRTVRSARITSINALFAFYRDRPEVADCLLRLANADIRAADVDESRIPGIEIITEQRAA